MHILPDDIITNRNYPRRVILLLIVLARHCGDKIVCWPSQARIAEFMGSLMGLGGPCSIRTVQRALREAQELQLVSVRRRWLRSNIYTVLCLEERQLSTMATPECQVEQTTLIENNVSNAVDKSSSRKKWVAPNEIHLLLDDIGEVMGERLLERNRGFYVKIIRSATATYELIQDALRFVKCSILEAEVSGGEITNPSGLFWWRLKEQGVRI
ncbi:helix-turn-helix domain-containing protein [Thermodesulfobacteriota bacterium]